MATERATWGKDIDFTLWKGDKGGSAVIPLILKSLGGKRVRTEVQLSVIAKFTERFVAVLMSFNVDSTVFSRPLFPNGFKLEKNI